VVSSGPPINSPAPDFALPAHDGSTYRLADHVAGSAVLLVFYRGHWCPFCRRYLCKLQSSLGGFLDRGVTLAAISPEPRKTSASLAADLGVTFPLLSDADGDVIARYGVRNGFASVRSLLPHPAVFLIDAERTVRFKSIDRNYKRRTTMPSLFRAIATMQAPRAA
jgi:peroxiredoxin